MDALALPVSFVGVPNWHVIRWITHGPWYVVAGKVALIWILVDVVFVIWWAKWGAEWLFGPRKDDDE